PIGAEDRCGEGEVDHGGAPDAHFQIAADGAAETGLVRDRSYSHGGRDAGRLAHVDREDVRGAGAGEDGGIVFVVDTLVGDDRHSDRFAYVGQPLGIAGRDGLLGEPEIEWFEAADHLDGVRRGPRTVGVDAETDVGADGGADFAYPRDVLRVLDADLYFHRAKALLDRPLRGARRTQRLNPRNRPFGRDELAHGAAQQAVNRYACGLARDVPQRHFQRGFSEGVAEEGVAHADCERIDLLWIFAAQQRLEDRR